VSLYLEWLGIAEGVVIDSRGAATLVGVNQNVITPQALPVAWTGSVFVLASESPIDLPADQEISGHVTLDFLDPAGEVISSSTQAIKSQRRYKDIPATLTVAAQVVLGFQQAGRYTIKATLKSASDDDHEEGHEKHLYVLAPPDQ
jgi:hypothetical protein